MSLSVLQHMAVVLRRFCPRSLLKDSLDADLIDKIPGRQNDRKTPLGELNWIFTAITDTIAWNVLPRGQWIILLSGTSLHRLPFVASASVHGL